MPTPHSDTVATRAHIPREQDVFNDIAHRAAAADRGESDLRADIEALVESGLLARLTRACLPGGDTLAACDMLRAFGRANLSVGRLVEGHANALRLIRLYGEPAQQDAAQRDATEGAVLHGVWGADADPPVRVAGCDGMGASLQGRKKFCSGLGLVRRAVVTARDDRGVPQMLLVDVSDARRADPGTWQVSGMRATASGGYDLTGLRADFLGQPGDFLREPHFEGGIWRYLALHTGALEALAEGVRRVLGPRATQPLHAARLVDLVIAANTARLWLESTALGVEASRPGSLAVPRVLLARQAIDVTCRHAIALAERAVGTVAFMEGAALDRVRRDLAFFLRQADLDGKMLRAATALESSDRAVGEMW